MRGGECFEMWTSKSVAVSRRTGAAKFSNRFLGDLEKKFPNASKYMHRPDCPLPKKKKKFQIHPLVYKELINKKNSVVLKVL